VRRLSTAAGGRVPAISLTAHARDEDRRHAMDSGFQAHLAKPVNVPLLVTTIRRLLSDKASAAAVIPASHAASASADA
jgi:CheY-like chemotaxis protein